MPLVTPPSEKPLSELSKDIDESLAGPICDITGSLMQRSDSELSDPLQEGNAASPRHERSTNLAMAPAAKLPVPELSSKNKYQPVMSQEEAESSFTYVSTLSPDSRASSSNFSPFPEHRQGKPWKQNVEHPDGGENSASSSNPQPKQAESGESKFPAAEDLVEVVKVIQVENFVPEVVISDSLKNASDDLTAPVWQYSSEEANRPVERKRRRRPRRKSTGAKAPFMSPKVPRSARQGVKRKFVDLTDFKSPSGAKVRDQSKLGVVDSAKLPPAAPRKNSNHRQSSSSDVGADWTTEKKTTRSVTFSRKGRVGAERTVVEAGRTSTSS